MVEEKLLKIIEKSHKKNLRIFLYCQEERTRRSERPSRPDEQQQAKVKVSYVPVRQKGLKVIARIDADGFYYPGLLTY